jgi:effector-binding domain-containing protein
MNTYGVTTRTLVEQPTIARRASLPAERIGPWLAETYAQISAYLNGLEIAMAGPPYARYSFHGDRMDVEAGFPVSAAVPSQGSIQSSLLPGGTAATAVHLGPYEGLEAAYKAVMEWLVVHGCEPVDGHWEIYYTDPSREPDSSRWRTEVVAPYTKVHAAAWG